MEAVGEKKVAQGAVISLVLLLLISTVGAVVCPWECARNGRSMDAEAAQVNPCHETQESPGPDLPDESRCKEGWHESASIVPAKYSIAIQVHSVAQDLNISLIDLLTSANVSVYPPLTTFSWPPAQSSVLRI